MHITRVYEVLRHLEGMKLATRLPGEPALYNKVSPRGVIGRLLEMRERKLDSLKVALEQQVTVLEVAGREMDQRMWVHEH